MKFTREQKAARYKALPIAKIEKPLRYIADKTTEIVKNEKTGEPMKIISAVYYMAKDFARIGDGATVQKIARQVLKENS